MESNKHRRPRTLLIALLLVAVAACDGGGEAPSPGIEAVGDAALATNQVARASGDRSIERDREIFANTVQRAIAEGIDSLPIGPRVIAIGRWFVGADYVPGTLEVQPEQLVVNLEEFDCVTYVESMLAIARVLDEPEPTFDRFLEELRRIRYRQGRLDGYASRLHYFSEWIADNDALGIVRNVTRELGGVELVEPIDFMTTNRDLYSALEADEVYRQIRNVEESLSSETLYYIPKDRIAEISEGIRDGDIIAATSSIEGLDVAHTGFAIWIDGELHFMNAPLVGRSVEISELSLAARIQRIPEQDGIMVARPL